MAPIKKFVNERHVDVVAKRVWNDAELADFDKQVAWMREKHPKAPSREIWERAICLAGGGTMGLYLGHWTLYVYSGLFAAADDKLEQWSRWRARKFPFDQRMAYERWAEQSGHSRRNVAAEKTVVHHDATDIDIPSSRFPLAAAKAVAADIARTASYPDEDINPDDIPF